MTKSFKHGLCATARPCPRCASVVAVYVWEFVGGLMWTDTWACAECGTLLHEWEWQSTMVAAQEVRAEMERVPLSKKGQLDLW